MRLTPDDEKDFRERVASEEWYVPRKTLAKLLTELDAVRAERDALANARDLQASFVVRWETENKELRAALEHWKKEHGMKSLQWKCPECESIGDAALEETKWSKSE